jgi:pimeloyl-ACP methyl ester carboxylesterase
MTADDIPSKTAASCIMADGATIILRRLGNPDGPRLAFCHGNGFATEGYRVFWEKFLPDFDIILFDLRNHGRNPRHIEENHRLAPMVADFRLIRAGIDQNFGVKPVAGLFHSLSAIVAILASAEGVAWDALVLFDPPLAPPSDHPRYPAQEKLDHLLADWARKRADSFASLADFAQALASSRPYRNVRPGAAADMAAATTVAGPEGTRVLSCPGAWEARLYIDNLRSRAYVQLGAVTCPLLLVGADAKAPGAMAPSLTVGEAAAEFRLDYEMVNDTGHMLQLERPDDVYGLVRVYLSRIGFVSRVDGAIAAS